MFVLNQQAVCDVLPLQDVYTKLVAWVSVANVLEEGPPEIEKNFKSFLEQGDLGKKAPNDKRRANS